MKKKYLVTGGSGFIGSALVKKLLNEGHSVRVFDNNSRGNLRRLESVMDQIEFVEGDIRDLAQVEDACKDIDAVCHLAFVNGTKFFYELPELVLEVGVKGMMNILDACIAHSIDDITMKMIQINQNNMLKILSEQAILLSKKYSWERHAKEVFSLYSKSTEINKNWNFSESYDVAAYRTLTTLIELFATDKRDILIQSLLNFNYPKIISWAVEYGLSIPQCKDFLSPFKDWLMTKNMENTNESN